MDDKVFHIARKRYKFSKEINIELNNLIELDNWHGLLALAYDYCIIAFAIALYFISPYFYPLIVVIIGSRQGALSNILHDSAHSRLAKNTTLNYILGTYLSGYLIVQEYYTFIDSHVKGHHQYLGDKKADPDYSYHIQSNLYGDTSIHKFVKQFILKPLFLGHMIDYTKHIFTQRAPTIHNHKKYAFRMYAYLSCIILVLVYFNLLGYFFLFWIVPFLTVFPIIGWFIDLAEHYPLVAESKIDLFMTRNRFSHFIEGFLFNPHNENYHLVHHLRPAIPFWNLGKAHHILLKDKTYRELNRQMGGIFLSIRGKPSFIKTILDSKRHLSNEKHKTLQT